MTTNQNSPLPALLLGAGKTTFYPSPDGKCGLPKRSGLLVNEFGPRWHGYLNSCAIDKPARTSSSCITLPNLNAILLHPVSAPDDFIPQTSRRERVRAREKRGEQDSS